MISDNLPKGREEGKDNRIFDYTINSADLPKKKCSVLLGKRVRLAQK